MTPVTLRWGVLGLGTIARAVHLPLIARTPGHELVAVADLDPARCADLAARYGARALDPGALLAAADVDAVLVATPGRHAAHAVDALRAGKHVLAEKPLALSEEEARGAAAEAAARGLHLQVGYMKVHDRAVVAARGALRGIGDLRLVQISVRHPLDAPQVEHLRLSAPDPLPAAVAGLVAAAEAAEERALDASVGASASPAVRRLFRSVLCGSVVHELSLLRALGLGLPEFDHGDLLAWDGPAPPTIVATGRLAGGARFVLDWAWTPDRPDYRETVRITGTAGDLELEVAPPYRLDAPSVLTVVSPAGEHRPPLGADGAFQRQLESFAAAVGGAQPHPEAGVEGAVADLTALRGLLGVLV
ncbi:putative dehydrogenase [Kineococcus radiotolerans]|uniref:Putative dehydrogenase n=1 Tax=Kineococcus radiotolerans TaxID=131568 RepID=A0A7W4TLG5_KINRA|nr:Gfo/Idh/MocA family oxidoreductase [Kineococcus radiotolerans]MBB2901104.1 putative dehydrogenase [Kineococcus radiotolerans]